MHPPFCSFHRFSLKGPSVIFFLMHYEANGNAKKIPSTLEHGVRICIIGKVFGFQRQLPD